MFDLSQLPGLLAGIVLLLIAAHAAGRSFELLKLPRVIGEIVGGLLVGPTLLLHFFANELQPLFVSSTLRTNVVWAISQIGLVLLMFGSGTHLRSFVSATDRKLVSYLAVVGIVIPFALGVLAVFTFSTAQFHGPAANAVAFTLVFATAIAIASIPVISRIMMDLGIMDTPFARIVLTTAVIDDLVLYGVLAVALALASVPGITEAPLPTLIGVDAIPGLSSTYHIVATIALMLAILYAAPRFLQRASALPLRLVDYDGGAIVQIILLIAVTSLSIFLGVNPMFAALVAGMVVGNSTTHSAKATSRSIEILGRHLFIPLYFAIVGFKLDLIRHFNVMEFVAFLVFACVVKSISVYAAARAAGESNSNALNLAAALNARGGPGIVLATVAFDGQIINENFYAILVLTAIVTSLFSGVYLAFAFRERTELFYSNVVLGRRRPGKR